MPARDCVMCGRFTQLYSWRDLVALYRIHDQAPANLAPRYNIAPTQDIDMIIPEGDRHRLVRARWGLVPAWWQKPLNELPATFNARAETVSDKPMFRAAVKSRRCIVPASGFYEWTGPKSARQPWYITLADDAPMSFAGLWKECRNPATGEQMLSATIIVCAANPFMATLHDRMPVILDAEGILAWLAAPRSDLLRPVAGQGLRAWRVSPKINASRYADADAVMPLD